MYRRCGKCVLVLLSGAAVLLGAAPRAVRANVYASGMRVDSTQLPDGGTIAVSFILNEAADLGVTAEIVDAAATVVQTLDFGPLDAGAHSFRWSGTGQGGAAVPPGAYRVRIRARDDGYVGEANHSNHVDDDGDGLVDESWALISDPANPAAQFVFAYGVDVNRNMGSPHFGRIYVAEAVGGTAVGGRVTADGIYILNADLTDAVGQGAAPRTGGVAWLGTSAWSPHKLRIGPDDRVYVTDWSDAHSGLWVGDPDFTAAAPLLSEAGRKASGLCVNHGSVSAVWVEWLDPGDLAAGVALYTLDEDWPTGAAGSLEAHRGSILRYDVGTQTGYAGAPAIVYDDSQQSADGGGLIVNASNQLARDSLGQWYISQYRFGTAGPQSSVIKVSPDGSQVLWRSFAALSPTIGYDPFGFTRDLLALDPGRDRLAGSAYYDGIVTFIRASSLDPGTVDEVEFARSPYLPAVPGRAFSARAGVFDPAGNLVLIDADPGTSAPLLGLGMLEVWSPPDGENSFTTTSWFEIEVGGAAIPEFTAIARTGSQVTLTWTGGAGARHLLEAAASPAGPWETIATIDPAGATNSRTLPLGAGAARCFRVTVD